MFKNNTIGLFSGVSLFIGFVTGYMTKRYLTPIVETTQKNTNVHNLTIDPNL